jgi:benzodiazapine receptor
MKRTNPTIALLLWLTAAYTASFAGMQGALRGLEVYFPSLHRPAWTPPLWLFGPVWTILYALIGFAAWKIWMAEPPRRAALVFWWIQLGLNALWPWLFFAWGKLLFAFIESFILWLVILATAFLFAPKDKLAARLLYPSLTWVAFATILNMVIWRMNP